MSPENPPEGVSWYRARYEPGAIDPDTAAHELKERGDLVREASPNYYRATQATPNDPGFPQQWGLRQINAPDAWEIERGQASVVVAVLDTGCAMAHPELSPAIIGAASTDLVDINPAVQAPTDWAWDGDRAGRDNDPADEVGHGTHVAGIIGARANNGLQGAGVAGCSLMIVRVLARLVHISGTVIGFGTSFDITAGIQWAIDHHASIINMSFGFTDASVHEKEAVERAFASGIVVVAAMGNDRDTNAILRPAAYRDVIAVGALEPHGGLWNQSQTGTHISLVAPGVDIESTLMDGGFGPMNGTSMAAAFVSGVAALVRSHAPELSARQIRKVLQDTADPLSGGVRPNQESGWGCVNAAKALVAVSST